MTNYEPHSGVDALIARLGDSEEFAGDAAIPGVAEDAATALKTMSEHVRGLELNAEKTRRFFQSIAELKIWDWRADDGKTIEECECPADGYADSHDTLMNAIGIARNLLADDADAQGADLINALQRLKAAGLRFSDILNVYGDDESDPYVRAAKANAEDGAIEVDTPAVVSRGAANGAYVLAWMWVDDDEAGVRRISTVLEDVCEIVIQQLDCRRAPTSDVTMRLRAYARWLEQVLRLNSWDIDDVANATVADAPASVSWTDEGGNVWSFCASDAISQLRLAAKGFELEDQVSDQIEQYLAKYGNKLDSVLARASQPA